jgi:hypothetical protein
MDRLKTLRGYTRPVHLKTFDHLNWLVDDHAVDIIEKYLYTLKVITLLSPEMVLSLSPLDDRSFNTHLSGVNMDGLYKC